MSSASSLFRGRERESSSRDSSEQVDDDNSSYFRVRLERSSDQSRMTASSPRQPVPSSVYLQVSSPSKLAGSPVSTPLPRTVSSASVPAMYIATRASNPRTPLTSISQLRGPNPPPQSELARYRILSKSCGLRVSPMALGCMAMGNEWPEISSIAKETAFKVFDAYFDAGGNFFDIALAYHNGQSEEWLGEWMELRGVRDRCVVATKWGNDFMVPRLGKNATTVNYGGNSRKSLTMAIQATLKKLRTTYVDIVYLHFWDYTTSIEEVMDSLHTLVESGKTMYLGVSNVPAWLVAAMNDYARHHGKTQFCVYQGMWSLGNRDIERDIVPMCRHYGMAVAPFGVLGSGRLRSRQEIETLEQEGGQLRWGAPQSENEARVSEALERVAAEHGTTSVRVVALAWVLQKGQYIVPVVGARRPEHVVENIDALSLRLTPEQVAELEAVTAWNPGYPWSVLGGDDPATRHDSDELPPGVSFSAHMVYAKVGRPIGYE